MKKVLIFSIAYYPRHVSGAEAAVKEITERIADIEFHMVTLRFDPTDPAEEKIGTVLVHRVGSGSGYFSKIFFPVLAALKARTLNKKYRFDALWALMTYMLLPVVLAKMLGVRAPHVFTLQDGDPYGKVFGRVRIVPFVPLIDRGFRTASVIQVISSYLGSWPKLRGSTAPVELIRNGANPKDLKESVDHATVKALKQKLGKKEGDVWLVNTARLEHQKAQDDVIRALTLLPDNILFLIVGGGSDEVMLKNLTQELHLEDRVMFVGQVTRDEVTAYRKASDIFVGPSRSEGLGNAFLSAMASRLPVVATAEGGLADFMSENTGWVVPKDNPEAIAAAVKDILAHPEKVKQIADTARKMVEDEYDWDAIAKEMRNRVFSKVL
ncbi:MAG TPA: glycosyltransferase family 4 protein [Candidatus Paceibacterota bacterium]